MQVIIDSLTISSLIFFNIFCLIGIFTLVVIVKVLKNMKRKTDDTIDTVNGVLYNIHESIDKINKNRFLTDILGSVIKMFGGRR